MADRRMVLRALFWGKQDPVMLQIFADEVNRRATCGNIMVHAHVYDNETNDNACGIEMDIVPPVVEEELRRFVNSVDLPEGLAKLQYFFETASKPARDD